MLVLTLLLSAYAEDDRGTRLAALRTEVDTLRDDVRRERAALDARLGALQSARADVDLEISRETLALERLQLALDDAQKSSRATEGQYDALIPVLTSGILALRGTIEAGLPFRRAERLAALAELETALTTGSTPPDKVASRLWQQVEDELSLARENAVDRQVIVLDGQEHLSDVARLGMVALYFRTPTGEVGWAERDGRWTRATGRTERAQIDELFTALEQRTRTGWFELPGGLPEVTP